MVVAWAASLWPGRHVLGGRGLGQLIVWTGLGCSLVLVEQSKQTRANSPGQVILRFMTSEGGVQRRSRYRAGSGQRGVRRSGIKGEPAGRRTAAELNATAA